MLLTGDTGCLKVSGPIILPSGYCWSHHRMDAPSRRLVGARLQISRRLMKRDRPRPWWSVGAYGMSTSNRFRGSGYTRISSGETSLVRIEDCRPQAFEKLFDTASRGSRLEIVNFQALFHCNTTPDLDDQVTHLATLDLCPNKSLLIAIPSRSGSIPP